MHLDVPAGLEGIFDDARRRVLGSRATVPTRPVAAEVVDAIDAAVAPVVLAGPGVVREGAVPGLRALADAGSLGVLNTWGAKGVFDWQSPHHLATVGLQARDFERGGLTGADLIVATGIDEREAQAEWRLAPVVEVPPSALGELAGRIAPRQREITVPPLRADLAIITQTGWTATGAPLPPTKVTQHYSQALGNGGLVAADPGTAGFWVARTFATTHLGGVLVTADPAGQGFAVACAILARLEDPGRPVLAVVDRIDEPTERALAMAASRGITVPVEVWDANGPALDAESHETRLRALVREGGQASIATDPAQLEEMLAVAGPIVAWTR